MRWQGICRVAIFFLFCWAASPCHAGDSAGANADKLIKVTLETKKAMGVMPMLCYGVDAVNFGGRISNMHKGDEALTNITLECLPGAIVMVIVEQDGGGSAETAFVKILPEDDGKTLRIRREGQTCYKNDELCWINVADADGRAPRALAALRLAVKEKKTNGLTVGFDASKSSLSLLQELKGTGVGLVAPDDVKNDKGRLSDAWRKELGSAIADVEPRFLEIGIAEYAIIKDRLAKVESLGLTMDASSKNGIPDLSGLRDLRHLTLVTDKGTGSFDLKPLAKLTQLKSLTVFTLAQEATNWDSLSSLTNLQFLLAVFKSPCDVSAFERLPKLRYLASTFAVDCKFAFTEKLPVLQTLCILNITEKHNLKPLEKLKQLQCLALTESVDEGGERRKDTDEFKPAKFRNVQDFKNARTDVAVVEYRGICLGSLWLLPMVILAAIVAWMMRRRHLGKVSGGRA